jgi:hypothetical protein
MAADIDGNSCTPAGHASYFSANSMVCMVFFPHSFLGMIVAILSARVHNVPPPFYCRAVRRPAFLFSWTCSFNSE